MTTGYVVSGRGDLDALFKPRTSAAIANTGFTSNGGVDLAQRFEPRGATAAQVDTGFKAGANDLAQLFMDTGAIVGTITISNVNWLATQPSTPASTASSSHQLTTTGDINRLLNGITSDEGDWVSPKTAAPSTFKVQVDIISGAFAAGSSATGVQLSLSAGPHTWTVSRATAAGVGSDSCQYQMTFFDGAGNFLAFASNFLGAQIVAAGTLIANVSETAAANSGLTTQIGFQRYTLGLADFGSVTSQSVDGGTYLLEQCCRRQDGTGNLFGLSAAGSTFPADADTTWQRCELTGIFSDSGGASVTRTLARTSCTVGRSDNESGRAYRMWTANVQPWPFIAGNTYTVKIYKS